MMRFYKILNEGINVQFTKSGAKLVSIVDFHEKGVDTSIASNPTKAVYKMADDNDVTVYSIFKRNDELKQDGNPLLYAVKNEKKYAFASKYIEKLFWERFNLILDKFINEYHKDLAIISVNPTTNIKPEIVLPSSKPINSKIAEILHSKLDSSLIINDLVVKKSTEEIWDMCQYEDSYFYRFWKRRKKDMDEMYDKLYDILETMGGVFKIHDIEDMEFGKSIKDTLRLNPERIDRYHPVINNSNVLIIDDTITTGQSFKSAYDALSACYFPKTVTGLTMFSSK